MRPKNLNSKKEYYFIDIDNLNIYEVNWMFIPIKISFIKESQFFEFVNKETFDDIVLNMDEVWEFVFDNLKDAKKKELELCVELRDRLNKKIESFEK